MKSLPDEAIAKHIEHARKGNIYGAMHLYPIDGAVHTRRPDDTAWSHRDATWSMVIVGLSPEAADVDPIRTWARNYQQAVHPYDLAGAYPNFMMDDEGDARVRASFGPNHARLAAIKAKYDPENLFRVNHNIQPAAH